MYQIQVKRHLVEYLFLPSEGWTVTVHLDAMERGIGGQHPEGKREIAAECEEWLVSAGVILGRHPLYGLADLVAIHPTRGTFVLEVEGLSARQPEQAMYSALGQILTVMNRFDQSIVYGIALP